MWAADVGPTYLRHRRADVPKGRPTRCLADWQSSSSLTRTTIRPVGETGTEPRATTSAGRDRGTSENKILGHTTRRQTFRGIRSPTPEYGIGAPRSWRSGPTAHLRRFGDGDDRQSAAGRGIPSTVSATRHGMSDNGRRWERLPPATSETGSVRGVGTNAMLLGVVTGCISARSFEAERG